MWRGFVPHTHQETYRDQDYFLIHQIRLHSRNVAVVPRKCLRVTVVAVFGNHRARLVAHNSGFVDLDSLAPPRPDLDDMLGWDGEWGFVSDSEKILRAHREVTETIEQVDEEGQGQPICEVVLVAPPNSDDGSLESVFFVRHCQHNANLTLDEETELAHEEEMELEDHIFGGYDESMAYRTYYDEFMLQNQSRHRPQRRRVFRR